MKSYKQRKRKAVDTSRKQDERTGVPVKKSAKGADQGYQKTTDSVKRPHLKHHVQLQISPAKVKLQLFPINEETRMGLEKDGHNPFLELTLSARKRISSVVRHLNTKWGSSSVVLGHLMLFPYSTKLERIASCKRWTLNDSAITAGEVYVDVGSPSIFRLRYGWCSNLLEACAVLETPKHHVEKLDDACVTIQNQSNVNEASHLDVNQQKSLDMPTGFVADEPTDVVRLHSSIPWDDNLTNLSIGGLLSEISMQGKINGPYPNSVNTSGTQPIGLISDISIGDLLSEASLLGKMSNNNNPSVKLGNESSLQPLFLASSDTSVGGFFSEVSMLSNKNKLSPWYDDLTTLSIGGLLSEASLQAKACDGPEPKASSNETNLSILDAEETCHAFPVRKLQTDRVSSKEFQIPMAAKMNNENVFPKDFSCQELKTYPLPHFS
ncbi:hypothetical protein CASFOL_042743 [Castilleja foliolosa]|uniref:TSL-kinase interacting protein 1 n=1 Tax=Castilleja foliolosa TaxID=1961234 RepID=A0ABD3B983_9LAMI